jgi:penicillin V acylase-like amidase (Ntn superfamily)
MKGGTGVNSRIVAATLVALLLVLGGGGLATEVGPSPIEGACTSFCLDEGGHALFATNYDNQIWEGLLFVNKRGVTKTGWEPGTDGRYARWTARYGSVTFNLAANQMVWAGMNEAGLALSTMWLGETENPALDERPGLVSPLWLQYQLDTCATIEEVMANDARVRIVDTVDHYLICDRSGACAGVEFLEGRTVFHTGDDLPIKVLTNESYQRSVGAWQAGRLVGNALERFGLAADRVVGFQSADTASAVAYAFETLERASGQATGGSPTQWSIVFDMQDLGVHFRTSRNPRVRWLDFAALDFSCGSPIEMLDVHAPLSGDVSGDLGRYTFKTNLEYTRNFLSKWGGDLSPLEIEVLERGLDSFSCRGPAAPYQEERAQLISPLVGWATRALFYRLWPVGAIVALGIVALAGWRWRVRRAGSGSNTFQTSSKAHLGPPPGTGA